MSKNLYRTNKQRDYNYADSCLHSHRAKVKNPWHCHNIEQGHTGEPCGDGGTIISLPEF